MSLHEAEEDDGIYKPFSDLSLIWLADRKGKKGFKLFLFWLCWS